MERIRIAVTGATGLIGSKIVDVFTKEGDLITRLVRKQDQNVSETTHIWNPSLQQIDRSILEGQHAIIHLAGENISDGRWTASKKDQILASRVQVTRWLSEVITQLKEPPQVFITASAIGYYGNQPSQVVLDEKSPAGSDFLAHVVEQWEEATFSVKQMGIRVIHLRFGIVLSDQGGALAKMLPPFRLGLGGKIASGKQMMSWVSLDEIPKMIRFIIQHDRLEGPINVVSPQPVSNEEFTQCLGKVLHRPTFLPIPGFFLRSVLGEMADALLIGGARVMPTRLLEEGYSFTDPDLLTALTKILGNNK